MYSNVRPHNLTALYFFETVINEFTGSTSGVWRVLFCFDHSISGYTAFDWNIHSQTLLWGNVAMWQCGKLHNWDSQAFLVRDFILFLVFRPKAAAPIWLLSPLLSPSQSHRITLTPPLTPAPHPLPLPIIICPCCEACVVNRARWASLQEPCWTERRLMKSLWQWPHVTVQTTPLSAALLSRRSVQTTLSLCLSVSAVSVLVSAASFSVSPCLSYLSLSGVSGARPLVVRRVRVRLQILQYIIKYWRHQRQNINVYYKYHSE